MQIQWEKALAGNTYIPPGDEHHLHILDMELENTQERKHTPNRDS